MRHGDASTVKAAADTLAGQLRAMLGNRIYGPREPGVSRVKSLYLQRIMVKIEPAVSVAQVKNILRSATDNVRALKPFKGIDIYFDVDPQ